MFNVNNLFGSRDVRLQILDFLRFLPDELLIKIEYRMKTGKKLHLNPPITFNEKLQWLKLNDRKPIYTQMADKICVRDFIRSKIGEEYLVPIYGYWDNVNEIPFDTLPKSFVLKCTHDSGSVVLVADKAKINVNDVKKKLNRRLKKNAFWWAREWPYKNIKPRIVAEQHLNDGNHEYLPVYKFFCFNGKPRIIQQIQNDKQPNETVDYFDTNWCRLNMIQRFPNSATPLDKPKNLNKMLEIAEILSEGISFLRVDLYEISKSFQDETSTVSNSFLPPYRPTARIFFSECTFYTDAGYSIFEPIEENWDEKLGDWINLKT